jgi:hypothetical protein
MSRTGTRQGRGGRSTTHSITLKLNDLHDLFSPPRLNPFRDDYLPLNGVDQIALQLRKARLRDGLHVTFVLPAPVDHEDELKAEVQTAIKRYCDTRLEYLLYDLKARQLAVIRSLEIGLAILAGSLALGAAITRSETMSEAIRTLLSNAVSIFGSVALWSPADAFLFGIRPMYHDVSNYRAIRDMTFGIEYEKLDPTSVAASKVM